MIDEIDDTQTCDHGNDLHNCSEPCRRCGHPCGAHGAERDWCAVQEDDDIAVAVDCGCTGYTDDRVGIDALAEAVEG